MCMINSREKDRGIRKKYAMTDSQERTEELGISLQ